MVNPISVFPDATQQNRFFPPGGKFFLKAFFLGRITGFGQVAAEQLCDLSGGMDMGRIIHKKIEVFPMPERMQHGRLVPELAALIPVPVFRFVPLADQSRNAVRIENPDPSAAVRFAACFLCPGQLQPEAMWVLKGIPWSPPRPFWGLSRTLAIT